MALGAHLRELRNRIIKSFLAIAAGAIVTFIFFNPMAERLLGMGPVDSPPETWSLKYGLYLPDRVTLFPVDELPITRALRGQETSESEIFVKSERRPEGMFLGVSGKPISGPDGSIRGAIAVMRDITERVLLKEQLDRSIALSNLLRLVSAAANEAASSEAALQRALDAICAFTGWSVEFAFRRTSEADALVFAGAMRADPNRHAVLISATQVHRFTPGDGLPGKVLASGHVDAAPHRAESGADDERMRVAGDDGLAAAIAFPVLSGEEVTGVLEFFSPEPIHCPEDFGRVMQQAGVQLGRALERDRARESEHFFHSILDHVAHPIFVKDRRFRWVFLNRAFCSMVQRPCEEMLGKSDYDFFTKDEADFFRMKDREMFDARKSIEIDEEPITDALGRRHVLATTKVPLFDRSGEISHLVGIIHDLTRRKAAEEQARQLAVERAARETAEHAHRRAEFLAEASRVLSGSLVVDTTIRRVSRLPLGTLGDWCIVCTQDEKRELRVAAIAHHDPVTQEQVRACLEHGIASGHGIAGIARVVERGQSELLTHVESGLLEQVAGGSASGAESCDVHIHSFLCVPLSSRGRVLGAIALALSETPRNFEREDLELAEELARRTAIALDNGELFQQAQEAILARDEFLQVASHELRTPLTSLRLLVQRLLKPRGRDDEQVASGLQTILRQVDRLTLLITNLLDVSSLMSRQLELSREQVDLEFIVREVASSFSAELVRTHTELRLNLSGPAQGVWDGARLQQVVMNLLSNAVRFGAGKPIEVSLSADDELVRLTVIDHGIGIAREDVERIFGRFERAVSTRHFGGLGLGLFLTREIVEAHGGQVLVESRHGEGSRFTVVLPRRGDALSAGGVSDASRTAATPHA